MKMNFLLRIRTNDDTPADTFYFYSQLLPKISRHMLGEEVIQKTLIPQPPQWSGCCDGMPVYYVHIKGIDTSVLYFRSPHQRSDSIGFRITKSTIEYLQHVVSDTVIADYLRDVESYIDDSRPRLKWNAESPINALRKTQYGR